MTIRTLILAFCLHLSAMPFVTALPTGEHVVSGAADFDRTGGSLTIRNTDGTIINWDSFSIGSGELTNFIQSNSSSSVLNRVTGGNLSQIYGTLTSNGNVYLINPNGILVGGTGVIDTNSFIGSTLDVNDIDFANGGTVDFVGDSGTAIVNLGTIKASGGNVYLIAQQIDNQGTITAAANAGLYAGSDVYLADEAGGAVRIGTGHDVSCLSAIQNSGLIEAAQVDLDVANGNLYALAINNSGTVRSNGTVEQNGVIYFTSDSGVIYNSGTIDASGYNGGYVEVTSNQGIVAIDEGSCVDASAYYGDGGEVLLGGDYQGANTDVANAQFAYIDDDATINASAGIDGDGGKVIVWSDCSTYFNGQIVAQGGAVSGDGGFVETSGKQHLQAYGSVDASAVNGAKGAWLLDPCSVTIACSPTACGSFSCLPPTCPMSFTPSGCPSTADVGTIISALNGGTDVIVTATGDITVSSCVVKCSGTDASLTLEADQSVYVYADITSSSGEMDVVLNADRNSCGGGRVEIQSGVCINTNGGDIRIGGGAGAFCHAKATGASPCNTGVLINGATLDADGGNICIRGDGGGCLGNGHGVHITGGSIVRSNCAGVIFVCGRGDVGGGANNHGVLVDGNSQIYTGNSGSVCLHGQEGFGCGSTSVRVDGALTRIGNACTGFVDIKGDSIELADGTVEANSVTLSPFTPSQVMEVGAGVGADAPGTLRIDSAELGRIVNSCYLTLGSFCSGTMTVSCSNLTTDTAFVSGCEVIVSGNVNGAPLMPIVFDAPTVSVYGNVCTPGGHVITRSNTLTGCGAITSLGGGKVNFEPYQPCCGIEVSSTPTTPAMSWVDANVVANTTGFDEMSVGHYSSCGKIYVDLACTPINQDIAFVNPASGSQGVEFMSELDASSRRVTIDTGGYVLQDPGASIAAGQLVIQNSQTACGGVYPNVCLTDCCNAIGSIAADVASLNLHVNSSLSVDTAYPHSGTVEGINSSGGVYINVLSGDLSLYAPIKSDLCGTAPADYFTTDISVCGDLLNWYGSCPIDPGGGRFKVTAVSGLLIDANEFDAVITDSFVDDGVSNFLIFDIPPVGLEALDEILENLDEYADPDSLDLFDDEGDLSDMDFEDLEDFEDPEGEDPEGEDMGDEDSEGDELDEDEEDMDDPDSEYAPGDEDGGEFADETELNPGDNVSIGGDGSPPSAEVQEELNESLDGESRNELSDAMDEGDDGGGSSGPASSPVESSAPASAPAEAMALPGTVLSLGGIPGGMPPPFVQQSFQSALSVSSRIALSGAMY